MSKFAKKAGHLVVDTENKKLAVVGQKDSTGKSKKVLDKAGVSEDKPAKTTKAAKVAKAPKAEKAERVAKDDTRKITILNKENPHREGSGRYEAFEAVKKSKKVSDYIASGSKTKYLAAWEESGHINIA